MAVDYLASIIGANSSYVVFSSDKPAPKRLTRLDCPETQGALTRIGASADGRSCAYVAQNGGEVKNSTGGVRQPLPLSMNHATRWTMWSKRWTPCLTRRSRAIMKKKAHVTSGQF